MLLLGLVREGEGVAGKVFPYQLWCATELEKARKAVEDRLSRGSQPHRSW